MARAMRESTFRTSQAASSPLRLSEEPSLYTIFRSTILFNA
jgi:hypothetical protein